MIILPKKLRAVDTDRRVIQYKADNKLRDKFIKNATGVFADLFTEESNRVSQALRGTVNPSSLVNMATTQVEPFTEALVALHTTVGKAFHDRTLAQKASYDDIIREWIRQYVARQVVRISDTTKAQLKLAIETGITEGLSIPNIAKLIDELYLEEIIPNRSRTIARTEVISASNASSYITASSTGLPMKKIWLSTADDRTRDSHATANGQSVGITEAFNVGGQSLLFPGDTSLGASGENVIACRCTIYYQLV